MKVSDIYSGTYCSVKQWPIQPTEMVITAVFVEDDSFDARKNGQVIVLTFQGDERKFRLNKTNAAALVETWGDETKAWVGRTVTINRMQGVVKGEKAWIGNIEPTVTPPVKAKKGAK